MGKFVKKKEETACKIVDIWEIWENFYGNFMFISIEVITNRWYNLQNRKRRKLSQILCGTEYMNGLY